MADPDPIESGEALFAFDPDLRLVTWNHAMERLTGFAADETLGRRCHEVLQGVALDGTAVCVPDCPYARRMMEGASPPGPEVRIRTAVGAERRFVSFSLISIHGGADPRYLHLVQPIEEPRAAAPESVPELTARQLEVLELAAGGLSARRISARLGIAETTVRNHLSLIQFKLDCATREETFETARRLGLTPG